MSNNMDWIYSGYFCLAAETTITEIAGYFPETYYYTIAPHLGTGAHKFRMNIWSNCQDGAHPMPCVNSFIGDVFSSDLTAGTFSYADTGVVRHYSGFSDDNDIIYRLTYTLDVPLVLPAGEYFFSHDAQLDPGKLILEVDGPCPDDADGLAGHQIAVELWMRHLVEETSGFQAFLEFDPAKLQFESGTYTGSPFGQHIPPTIAAVGGTIDLASATEETQFPTTGDALLATLLFTVLDECETTAVNFRTPTGPFISELSRDGVPVLTALHNTADFDLDDTIPTVTAGTIDDCYETEAEAEAAAIAATTATDNCTAVGDLVFTAETTGDPCNATITVTVTDECGNEDSVSYNTTIDNTVPVISGLTVNGGDVDANCEHTVTFSATVTDNCCVNEADVAVAVSLLTGNATLGTPAITKTQTDDRTVDISGSVPVSDLTSCPATVQVTVNAEDCCDNAATQVTATGDVNDVTDPVVTCTDVTQVADPGPDCDAVVTLTASATDNCDTIPGSEDRLHHRPGRQRLRRRRSAGHRVGRHLHLPGRRYLGPGGGHRRLRQHRGVRLQPSPSGTSTT